MGDRWVLTILSKEHLLFNRNRTNSTLPSLPYIYKIKVKDPSLTNESLSALNVAFCDFSLYV